MPDAEGEAGQSSDGSATQTAPPQQQNEIDNRQNGGDSARNGVARPGSQEEQEPLCCTRDGWGLKLSPILLLIVFVYCNLLNYIDRGLVNGVLPKYCVNCVDRVQATACNASNTCMWEHGDTCAFNPDVKPQVGIGGSFDISETAQGVLAGAFMGGYCVFSPLIAMLSTMYPPFALMGGGLSAWVLAAGLAATAPSYHAMVVARVVSGIGEASFQCLAPCFIDDSAPPAVKGKWLAAFFMAVPIGQALGYVFGGYLCSALPAERLGFAGWRVAFALEGAAMLPVCLLCALVTNKLRSSQAEASGGKTGGGGEGGGEGGGREGAEGAEEAAAKVIQRACRRKFRWRPPASSRPSRLFRTVGSILCNSVWLCTVCGYGAFTFSLGAAAVWGPYFLQRVFKVELKEADSVFGAVAVVTGLLGTLSGGLLLDVASRRIRADPQTASLLLAVALVLPAYPLCIIAFRVESYYWFLALMFVGQFLAFAAIPTINGVLLWCVPGEGRALSMALSVVGIHLLGDVPSPMIVGAMLEHLQRPRLVLQIVMAWIGWCVVFWALACHLSRQKHLRRTSPLSQPLLTPDLSV